MPPLLAPTEVGSASAPSLSVAGAMSSGPIGVGPQLPDDLGLITHDTATSSTAAPPPAGGLPGPLSLGDQVLAMQAMDRRLEKMKDSA
eukprot:14886544-Heterocapsa_arctica.AAC.1